MGRVLNDSSFIKSFFSTASLQVLSKVLTVFIGIVWARNLGVTDYGKYSFIISVVTIASVPVIAGLPQLLIRQVAIFQLEKKLNELKGLLYWSKYSALLISVVVISIISMLNYFDIFEPDISNYILLAMILIPFQGMLLIQSSTLNGLRFPSLAQLPSLVFSPFIVLLSIAIVFITNLEINLQSVITIQVMSVISSWCLSFWLINSKTKYLSSVKPKYKIKDWSYTLVPFAIITIVGTLSSEIATVILGVIGSKESISYFKVAIQATALISLGLGVVNTIIAPQIARFYKALEMNEAQALLDKSVRFSCFISIPICISLILFGDIFISILFGVEYSEAIHPLRILCIGQMVNCFMGSVGFVSNMTGNERASLKFSIIALIINVFLQIVLIPIYGAIGAAVSIVISLSFWNVCLGLYIKSRIGLVTWFKV